MGYSGTGLGCPVICYINDPRTLTHRQHHTAHQQVHQARFGPVTAANNFLSALPGFCIILTQPLKQHCCMLKTQFVRFQKMILRSR